MKTARRKWIFVLIFTLIFVFNFSISPFTVISTALENEPYIWVNDVVFENGEMIRVPINIANNPGIIALLIRISYNAEMLELTSVENGTVFNKSSAVFSRDLSTNPYGISWEDGLSASNNTNNGILATLVFRVKDESTENRSEVAVTIEEDSTFDTELNPVSFETSSGLVSECVLWAKNGAVVDHPMRIIYGLNCGLESLQDYVYTNDDISFNSSSNNLRIWGTGSNIQLLKNEEMLEEYTIVIFGDVNGDGWYDGQDAVTVSMIAGGMLTREQVGEAVWMAADCNHDGVIDQADVDLLNQAGVLLSSVDQTKSTDELLETSAEYVEYLNLIDQQTDADSDEAPEDNTEENQDSLELSLWNIIVKYFIALIKKIASVIKVF